MLIFFGFELNDPVLDFSILKKMYLGERLFFCFQYRSRSKIYGRLSFEDFLILLRLLTCDLKKKWTL